MSSLGFDLLDRHVVDGRGDGIACADATGTLTFARLLERSAALAGGLGAVGVRAGDEVDLDVSRGNLQVVIVCACIRLGAVPSDAGEVRIADEEDGVVIHMGGDDVDLSLLQKVGASDPAPSLPSDPPGYRAAVRESFAPIVDVLLAGTTIA
ncbi:AMP-binding protein [Aeromicrobium sp.]|uniref:AMP-binding protein n=1 Tax=Aeromicrobium sp. TaxID=1871063 RepID=UPI003D6ACCD8